MPNSFSGEAVQAAAKAFSLHFEACDEPRWQDCEKCARVMDRTVRALQAVAPFVARREADYEELLGNIRLYIDWRYVTRKLTTEQRELFADAAEAWSRRLNDDNPNESYDMDRWWRQARPETAEPAPPHSQDG